MSEADIDEQTDRGPSRPSKSSGGAVGTVILLVMIPLAPLAVLTFLVAGTIAIIRKVRVVPMVLWTIAATLVALALVRFNPVAVFSNYLNSWLGLGDGLLGNLINQGATLVGADQVTAATPLTVPAALAAQLPLSLIIGFIAATILTAWARVRRGTLAKFEGEKFDSARPPGILDWVRRRHSAWRIRTGREINRRRGWIAVGTGMYGAPVRMPTRDFRGPLIVFGMIRSGKTMLACSIVVQSAQGGIIAIDFKGDEGEGSIVEYYGKFALANNRKFKHFALAKKSGADYRPSVDGLPTKPACYDPLRHGNADSKTNMLQRSVDREGNAAIYLQNAEDFTMIAYQVASIIGLDKTRSGFQTLHDLCSIEDLDTALTSRDENGQPYFDLTNPTHVNVMNRAKEIITKKNDQLMRAAIANTRLLLSGFMNGAAAGPWLRRGDTVDNDIDLLDAVTEGHIVVFSLPVQDYKVLATTLGNLAILDFGNVISSLRERKENRAAAGQQPAMDWKPCFFHVEEFGSAAPQGMLDVLNKSGDVGVQPILSQQSWNDLTSGLGESVANQILEQASNVVSFKGNAVDGPTRLSESTDMVTKIYPATYTDERWIGGILEWIWSRFQIRLGGETDLREMPAQQRQLHPSDIQKLGKPKRRHRNDAPTVPLVYEFIWIAMSQGKRVTHTFTARANNWVEKVASVLADPDASAKRYPQQIHPDVEDRPLTVAAAEVRRAEQAANASVTDAYVPPTTEPPAEEPDYAPDAEGPHVDRPDNSEPAEPTPTPKPTPAPDVAPAAGRTHPRRTRQKATPRPATRKTPATPPSTPRAEHAEHQPEGNWQSTPETPFPFTPRGQEPTPPMPQAPQQPTSESMTPPSAHWDGLRFGRHQNPPEQKHSDDIDENDMTTAPIQSTRPSKQHADTTPDAAQKATNERQNGNRPSVLDDPFAH